MNPLSMTASPSGMDPQQIPGMAARGTSYAQITRNSMSLWKLETSIRLDIIVIENITSTLSSDHFNIIFDTNITPNIQKTNRYILDFSNGDHEVLNNNFLDVNFIPCFTRNDIKTPVNHISQLFSMHVLSLYPILKSKPTNLQVVHPNHKTSCQSYSFL